MLIQNEIRYESSKPTYYMTESFDSIHDAFQQMPQLRGDKDNEILEDFENQVVQYDSPTQLDSQRLQINNPTQTNIEKYHKQLNLYLLEKPKQEEIKKDNSDNPQEPNFYGYLSLLDDGPEEQCCLTQK